MHIEEQFEVIKCFLFVKSIMIAFSTSMFINIYKPTCKNNMILYHCWGISDADNDISSKNNCHVD